MTDEELQEIADIYGLYTQIDLAEEFIEKDYFNN